MNTMRLSSESLNLPKNCLYVLFAKNKIMLTLHLNFDVLVVRDMPTRRFCKE